MSPSRLRDERLLPVEALRWTCDPAELGFRSTDEVPEDAQIIGQDRAVRALEFGLGIGQRGYNIFVSGPPGTGRSTYACAEVAHAAEGRPVPLDWCYVRNFAAAGEPVAISFPAGRGRVFRHDMEELVVEVREGLRRAFASDVYEKQRTEVIKHYEQVVGEIWQGLEQQARSRGLSLQQTPTGIVTVPVAVQGRPIPEETFRQLPEQDRTNTSTKIKEFGDLVAEALRKMRTLEREGRDALRDLERNVAQYMIDQPIARLKESYAQFPKAVAFLAAPESGFVTAQILTVDGGRMDYIGHP